MISGINGTKLALESMVKVRTQKRLIDQVIIAKDERGYTVLLYRPAAE